MSSRRRRFLQFSAAAATGALLPKPASGDGRPQPAADEPWPPSIAALQPAADVPAPISLDEHRARLRKAQALLAEHGLDALVVGPGTSLRYFSGAEWGLSERFFGFVLGRSGDPLWIAPAFEKRRALEQVALGGEVRSWEEHESPYALLAGALRERGAAGGRVAVEEGLPFVFVDGLAQELPAARIVSGTPVTAGCRMFKDAHELALMKRACENTLRAHRAVFAALRPGVTQAQVSRWCSRAHERLGMQGGALVLFGADAAFPHGTKNPQPLKAGDVVLIDGGGRLHGYASDITRTGVFGAPPSERQRQLWNVVREAQEAAFRALRPGAECQAADAAARRVIEKAGFGRDYERFTHRVGHGIGMDGHEWTYLVRGNTARLRPGMCFSDEPGIYIPGELGVRHEDIVFVTENGAENMTRWSGSPEDPAVV